VFLPQFTTGEVNAQRENLDENTAILALINE
jgi:hypothetical protein